MAKKELSNTNPATSLNARKHFKYRSVECLNCGQPLDLSDVYCPYCSQLNSTKPLSLKDFINEFLGSIISYDSRFRHTIKDLLFYPGKITKRYVNGERIKYANPFRFFLSVSIIYFLLSGLIAAISNKHENDFAEGMKVGMSRNKNTDSIPDFINGTFNGKDSLQNSLIEDKTDTQYSETQLDSMGYLVGHYKRFEMYNNFHTRNKELNTGEALDSLKQLKTRYNIWLYNRTFRTEQIQKNPTDFAQFVFNKIPFFLFFLAPVYALFFWLIYYRRKHKYIEHLIFIFHIFTFLFLAMLIAKIPDLVFGENYLTATLFGLIAPIYFYKSLRNYYQQSRWKTILKFVILNFVFFTITTFAILIFIFGTAAIY